MIIASGNHYIIQVKGNQKLLHNQLKINAENDSKSVDIEQTTIKHKGRIEHRKVCVYKNLSGISSEWIGLKRIIRVERMTIKNQRITRETAYYISSIQSNRAQKFAKHIQQHWGIENRLHWVKDVSMKEDVSKTAKGNAAQNISIMRNITINLFRTNGFDSIKYATQFYANNFKELRCLITSKTNIYKKTEQPCLCLGHSLHSQRLAHNAQA